MNRLLVCGGREWGDLLHEFSLIYHAIELLQPALIIEGGALGADRAAQKSAIFQDISCQTYHADWSKHGRGAGPIRNARMLNEGRPDAVLACPGGKGTANMVKQAVAKGVPVWQLDESWLPPSKRDVHCRERAQPTLGPGSHHRPEWTVEDVKKEIATWTTTLEQEQRA